MAKAPVRRSGDTNTVLVTVLPPCHCFGTMKSSLCNTPYLLFLVGVRPEENFHNNIKFLFFITMTYCAKMLLFIFLFNYTIVLSVYFLQIPIYKGASTSLLNRDLPETVHGGDGLGGCAHLYSTGGILEENMPAALALTTMAKNNPEEITLIAIGPLTNLAMAHRLDPEFTKNLKSIVIMGGNYKGITFLINYTLFIEKYFCMYVSLFGV